MLFSFWVPEMLLLIKSFLVPFILSGTLSSFHSTKKLVGNNHARSRRSPCRLMFTLQTVSGSLETHISCYSKEAPPWLRYHTVARIKKDDFIGVKNIAKLCPLVLLGALGRHEFHSLAVRSCLETCCCDRLKGLKLFPLASG